MQVAELKNARHEKFVAGIVSGLSQRKAYRAAFPNSAKWKDETVDNKACILSKKGEILARLQEIQAKATDEAVMSITERKKWLSDLVKNGVEETRDKLKAIEILNKMECDIKRIDIQEKTLAAKDSSDDTTLKKLDTVLAEIRAEAERNTDELHG